MRAKFITLEGGDGAGKTTLLGRIEEHLKAKDIRYVVTREPGGTPISEEIRELLLKPGREPTALTELFLYEAARAEHVEHFIKPKLREGASVICDRFTHSTLAYQGFGRGLGHNLVKELNGLACQGLKPDVAIWLKVTPATAKKRRGLRGLLSRLDAEAEDFHTRVYRGFEQLAEDPNQNILVLDGERQPEEIATELFAHPRWKEITR